MKSMPHAVHAMTMVRSYFQIILVLTFQITTVATNWVSNKGLWYYISDSEDKRNYTDAVDYCAKLSGHLATIVNGDQWRFLKHYTGSYKYWVGLSTIHTKHTNNSYCKNADLVWAGDYTCAVDYISDPKRIDGVNCSAYTLEDEYHKSWSLKVIDCSEHFGFICQWQCHALQIISQHMSLITGVYGQQHYNYKSERKFYQDHSPYTNIVKSLDYKGVRCHTSSCSKGWLFLYENEKKLYYYFSNYTPYYQTEWVQHNNDLYNTKDVYFSCIDCLEYEITFSNGSTKNTTIVTKRGNYDYTNDSDPHKPSLSFDHDSAMWCYAQHNTKILCFEYDITPVGYVSTFTTQDKTKSLTINCTTMHLRDDNDIDEFTTKSQKPQSVTATAKLLSSEPDGTEEHQTVTTTHKPQIVSSYAYSVGIQTTHNIRSKYSSPTTAYAIVNTQNNDRSTKPTILDLFSPTTNIDHLTSTKLTTILLDLYSQTSDPQSDALQNEQDNLKNSNSNIYIGVGIGVVLLIVFVVIIGYLLYKRRKASKGNTKNATQNRDDVHVITDTNIYSEPSFTEPPISRAPHIPVRNALSKLTNTTETAPNIPSRNHAQSTKYAVTSAQGDKAFPHASSTDAHGSSNMPIYSKVNKHRKPVPPVPTEPVYSQVSKKAKTLNGEHKQDNKHSDGAYSSDSDIEFCDNDVYESKGMPCTKTHTNTGDNSDEEFSDNELYERGPSAPAHRQTNVSTNVVDNKAFDNASEDDNIEMVHNDVYGQM